MEKIIEKQIQVNDRKIALTIRHAEGPVIIVAHGFQAHRKMEMADAMAKRLHEDGFTVVSFDQNGHGDSEGGFAHFTTSRGLEDLEGVIEHVKSEFPKRKIGIAGNSLGGTIALLAASKDPAIQALALHAPMSDFKEAVRTVAARKGIPFELARWAWKAIRSFPYRDSHDRWSLLHYKYYEDGVTHDVFGAAGKTGAPVLVTHGDKDETVPHGQSERLSRILETGHPHNAFHSAPGGTHEFTEVLLKRYTRIASRFFQNELNWTPHK